MTRRIVILAVLVSLAVAPVAQAAKQYVLKHPKREHCKAHYVKRVEKVKRREHGQMVKIRETVCVYVKPEPKLAVKAPAPTPAAPAAVVTLKAHIDSFVQSPTNPFAITYLYSASATETLGNVSQPAPSPPQGVLNLYADGLLACSINVGGSTAIGECPVHESMGAHTIVVTYMSGLVSTSETSVEQVSPFPIAATTTTETITDDGCSEREPEHFSGVETTCTYAIGVHFDKQNGPVPSGEVTLLFSGTGKQSEIEGGHEKTFSPSTISPSLRLAAGSSSCSVTMDTLELAPHMAAYNQSSITGSAGCPGSFNTARIYDEWAVAVNTWTIVAHGEAGGGFGEGGGGWLASESAPQTVTG